MTAGGSRQKRVAERVRADLSEMLARGVVRDPAAEGAIVSDVAVSGDLGVATIFLRTLEEASPERQKRLLAAMGRASGFLRRELGRTLALRRVPEIRFEWDQGADRAARLESIFEEIRTTKERER